MKDIENKPTHEIQDIMISLFSSKYKIQNRKNLYRNLSMVIHPLSPESVDIQNSYYSKENAISRNNDHKIFFDIIEKSTQKIKFNSSMQDFKDSYVFSGNSQDTINSSEEKALAWISNLLDRINHNDAEQLKIPSIVCGDIGSGKSTFIKYILVVFRDVFRFKKVIPSRIEYKRMEDYLKSKDKYNRENEFNRFVMMCIARDVLFYLVKCKWENNEDSRDFITLEFNRILKDYASKRKSDRSIINKELKFNENMAIVRKIIDHMENDEYSISAIWSLSDDFISIIISIAKNHGYKFISIYDGFDVISPMDLFLENKNVEVLRMLFEYIYKKDMRNIGNRITVDIRPANFLILRSNTYALFTIKFSSAEGFPKPLPINFQSPRFKNILKNRANCFTRQSGGEVIKNELLEWFEAGYATIQDEIAKIISDVKDLDVVFNNNYRRCLEVFRDFMHIALADFLCNKAYDALKINGSHTFKNVMSYLIYSGSNTIKERPYLLLRIIILGGKFYFQNWTNVIGVNSGGNSERYCFSMNDAASGYVDNVFNYDFQHDFLNESKKENQKSNDVVPLLLCKIRSLQILSILPDRGVSEEIIHERLVNWFGYRQLSVIDVRRILTSLLYAEFCIVVDIKAISSYQITQLGLALIKKICVTNTYLEHVCLKVNIPFRIAENLKKYSSSDINRYTNTIEVPLPWYRDCPVNSLIFSIYIMFCEEMENELATKDGKNERDSHLPDWKVFEKMHNSIVDSTKKMCNDFGDDRNQKKEFMIYLVKQILPIEARLDLKRFGLPL
ncbi:hypothetical protein [Azospirillum sp.]|uniref:hypothetical protein n=1 Tax=Azospirillum sp. TaxID=34012 RepID=UPI002637E39F|nr:hypothetical protein [Azospirillum sp.]